MEIINALQAKKLNSQITCTSYYDFLNQERRCLEAFNRMGMQGYPPSETEVKDPLGSAMDSVKHYDVDDIATEWYLGTRTSPFKRKFCSKYPIRQARQRRLQTISYRRVSPEFLSLLKQHHDRTQGQLHRKCRRPKASFAYYKYDAEGKRRHMRPGIDTAAPLEFPNPMEIDDPEYRKRLLRGQRSEEVQHGLHPLSPKSKRVKNRVVRRTRDKGNQDRSINAKDLKWLEVANLGFPSTTKEAKGNTDLKTSLTDLNNKDTLQENIETGTNNHQMQTRNLSVPEPPHLHDPPPLNNLKNQLAKYSLPLANMATPFGKNKRSKDPRIISLVKSAFIKVIQSCSDEVSLHSESSEHSNGNQCTCDRNDNNSEMLCLCEQKVSDDSVSKNHTVNISQENDDTDKELDDSVCKTHTVNTSQKNDVTDKKCRGILRKGTNSRTCASDSEFCKMKKVRIATCNYPTQKKLAKKNPSGSKMNSKITGQEGSRLGEYEDEKPSSSGNNPHHSEKPLPPIRPSFTLNAANQREEGPSHSFSHQKTTSKCSSQKQLNETKTNGPKINPEITGQEESRLTEGKHEKPNCSGNSPDNSARSLTRKETSCSHTVVEPSSLKTNQSKSENPPNIRKVDKLKPCPKIRNVCQSSKPEQQVPPKENRKNSELSQEETCKCPSQKDSIETKPKESKMHVEIKGKEKPKVAERKNEKPNLRCKNPFDSKLPLACKGTSFAHAVVEPNSCNYLKINQSKVDNPPSVRKLEKPKICPKIRSPCQSSKAEQQVPPKEGHTTSFSCRQKMISKCCTQKQLTETNPKVCKVNTKIMGQESGLAVKENEKPNLSGNSPDNSGKPLPIKRSICTRTVAERSSGYFLKTNQSKWDNTPNSRIVEKPKTRTEIRNTCKSSKTRQHVPPKEDQNQNRKIEKPKTSTETRKTCPCPKPRKQIPPKEEEKTSNWSTPKELSNTNSYVSKATTVVMGQESRLAVRENKSRRPLRRRRSSTPRKVVEPSNSCHSKTNQSKKKILDDSNNCRKVKKLPNIDPNHNKKRCSEQLRKCGTESPRCSKAKERNSCPEARCNLMRYPTKPIPIRCDPITRKCVPFPHSSGNEKTDLKRWLYPSANSGRRCKRYTKTRKTLRKGSRATKKCHQSDSSTSCEENPCRVRLQQRARGESCCRCPCCSAVFPPSCRRFQEVQENYQRCCPHSKRWHCKPKCPENSQASCEETSYDPTVSREFTSYWGSRRLRGGVDLRKDFNPRRNRGVPYSFSSSLSSDSDINRHRKWSVHAFRFD